MEGNLPTEIQRPVGGHIVVEAPLLITPDELDNLRQNIRTSADGKLLLRNSGFTYHDRLRSYLATEFSGKVDNPAAEIPPGGKVDPWVPARIGSTRSPEEAFVMDARFGASMWEKAERALGVDAIPIIKSILKNGINVPTSKGEYRDLYYKAWGFLNQVIQDASFRQRGQVRINSDSEAYRAETLGQLERSPDAGIFIPSTGLINGQIREILPTKAERKVRPWEKIKNYASFLSSLSARDRDGLELMTDLNPMGLRWALAPALKKSE